MATKGRRTKKQNKDIQLIEKKEKSNEIKQYEIEIMKKEQQVTSLSVKIKNDGLERLNIKELKEPFIRKRLELNYIDILNFNDSKFSTKVSQGCYQLLKEIPIGLDKSYRLELVLEKDDEKENESIWNLQVSLDPNEWFYLKYKGDWKEKEDAINQAKQFIKNVNDIERETYYDPVKHPQNSNSFCKRENCNGAFYNVNRKSGKKELVKCHRRHIGFLCNERLNYFSNNENEIKINKKCGLIVSKESIWKTFPVNEKGKWIICSRFQEFTRELLIIPDSGLVKSNIISHGNKNCVQNCLFWRYIQKTCIELNSLQVLENKKPVTERIVINFGKWETGMRLLNELEECHAHGHIWLSYEFVRNLQTKEFKQTNNGDGEKLQYLLKEHINKPLDYLKLNADELQMILNPRLIEFSNIQLSEKIESLNLKLIEKLEFTEKQLTIKIESLNKLKDRFQIVKIFFDISNFEERIPLQLKE
ncbi:hypothetical protein RB653_003049 [Dictyostelium firmibasis]|uniref:Uncharacterized protein n=1 Tax=Dictyostelium firmibasis TaxID=79012 RepID=A0AAN7TYI7_9MYCE